MQCSVLCWWIDTVIPFLCQLCQNAPNQIFCAILVISTEIAPNCAKVWFGSVLSPAIAMPASQNMFNLFSGHQSHNQMAKIFHWRNSGHMSVLSNPRFYAWCRRKFCCASPLGFTVKRALRRGSCRLIQLVRKTVAAIHWRMSSISGMLLRARLKGCKACN